MFIYPFRTFDHARYSHHLKHFMWTALLLLSKDKVQTIRCDQLWSVNMAAPGECLEHVTKVTQARVSYSRPLPLTWGAVQYNYSGRLLRKTWRKTNHQTWLQKFIIGWFEITKHLAKELKFSCRWPMSRLFEAWKPVSGASVTGRIKMAWTVSGIDIFDQFPVIRGENVVLGICNVSGGNSWKLGRCISWWCDQPW